jgi:hypothetical protein
VISIPFSALPDPRIAPYDRPCTARAALRFGKGLVDLAIAITSPIHTREYYRAGAWPSGFGMNCGVPVPFMACAKTNCGMAVFCFPLLLRSEFSDECSEMRGHWIRQRVGIGRDG